MPISSVEETGWSMAEWLLQLKGYTSHAAVVLIYALGGLNPREPPLSMPLGINVLNK